jgi:hypothetical protein
MTDPAIAIVISVESTRQVSNLRRICARYLVVGSGLPDEIGTAVQVRTP